MPYISNLFSLSGIAWIAFCGLVVYCSNRYWKCQATKLASTWASKNSLSVIDSQPIVFRMHRQRPQISFEAVSDSGQIFCLTLQMRSSWGLGNPLASTALVEVLSRRLRDV